MNALTQVIDNNYLDQIIEFMNNTVGIVALAALLAFLGDLVWILLFPMNLLGPLLHGAAAIFVLEFVLRIIDLMGRMLPLPELSQMVAVIPRAVLYLVIFLIVIIAEYIVIFSDAAERNRPYVR